jgi:hypothetical protein
MVISNISRRDRNKRTKTCRSPRHSLKPLDEPYAVWKLTFRFERALTFGFFLNIIETSKACAQYGVGAGGVGTLSNERC